MFRPFGKSIIHSIVILYHGHIQNDSEVFVKRTQKDLLYT